MVLFLLSKNIFCYIPENESEQDILGWNKSWWPWHKRTKIYVWLKGLVSLGVEDLGFPGIFGVPDVFALGVHSCVALGVNGKVALWVPGKVLFWGNDGSITIFWPNSLRPKP